MRAVPQRFGLGLALIAATGLGIRVWSVLAWQRSFELHGDQVFYHHQANALADGFGYVNPYALEGAGWLVPTAAHPPVYSTYLAVVSLLGGTTPTAHKLASCLLGVATIVLVGLVARRLGGDRAGLLAAAIVAVAPNLWISDGGLVSEAAYAAVVALVLLAADVARARGDRWSAVWLGLALALAALTRAEALVLFVLLAGPLLLWWAEGPWRERAIRFATCCGVGALALAPWVGRNLVTFENPVGLSVGAGYVLEIANCDATYDGALLGYWSQECDRSTWPAGDESVVEVAKREVGLDYVRDHLDRLPVVVLARLGRMWDVYRPTQGIALNDFFERRGRAPSRWGLWTWWASLPAAAAGLLALRRRGLPVSPYVALALSVSLAAAMSFGITRYRVGAEVAVYVLAGVGLDAVLRRALGARARAAEAVT